MLTYGVPADATDEYVRIGESTALKSLRRFVAAIIDLFKDEYLRHPNEADTARLMPLGEQNDFSWNIRVYQLYALDVEELSSRISGSVQGACEQAHYHFISCCFERPLDMACLF
jgi:hypothetical protein